MVAVRDNESTDLADGVISQPSSHRMFYYWVGSKSVETSRGVPGSLGSPLLVQDSMLCVLPQLLDTGRCRGGASGMSGNLLGSELIKFTVTSSLGSGYAKEAKMKVTGPQMLFSEPNCCCLHEVNCAYL